MLADTPLEIWTTTIGWTWYNILWDIITATGIVFIPFIGMLVSAWREAYVEGGEFGAAARCVREVENKVYMALLVIVFAGMPSPLTSVSPSSTQYTPVATVTTPAPATVDGSASGDTFGQVFAGQANAVARVPFWWYAVMKVSSGINNAAITGMGSGLTGIRELQQQAQVLRIRTPALRAEAQRFYAECYVPARTKFLAAPPSPAAAAAINTHGTDDTEWIGSHAFQADATLYPAMYAASELPGWPYNPGDASAADVAGQPNPPQFGRPSCLDWWTRQQGGLHAKLLIESQVMGVNLVTQLRTIFNLNGPGAEDAAGRYLLTKEGIGAPTTDSTLSSMVTTPVRNMANTLTATIAYGLNWVTMGVVVPGLRFLQPLLLMGIYALLAFYIVLARFELEALVIGALGIFTIKFWSVLWYGVDWLDEYLISALYPSADGIVGKFLLNLDQLSTVGDGELAKRMVLDLTVLGLYVLLPTLWTAVMGWAGVQVGAGLGSLPGGSARTLGPAGDITPLIGGKVGAVLSFARKMGPKRG